METRSKFIGTLRHNLPDIALEYSNLAVEDEQVGQLLMVNGKYRHAIYFFVQAMEKYVRHKIFTLVNPSAEYFRSRTYTHNVDELLDFLVEIVSNKPAVRQQVKEQLESFVLNGIRFGKLHNDLRYPIYSEKFNSYSSLQVTADDAKNAQEKLQKLKRFLQDMDRLSRA